LVVPVPWERVKGPRSVSLLKMLATHAKAGSAQLRNQGSMLRSCRDSLKGCITGVNFGLKSMPT
jgi:hypothetical protein